MMKLSSPCRYLASIIIFSAAAILFAPRIQAQSADYRMANRYMQQQKYEEALPILRELHQENPSTYLFFESLTECYVNLKMYDEAIETAEKSIENGHTEIRTEIKLAEIYHLSEQTERALEKWRDIATNNSNRIQVIHNVAESMSQRREYEAAIKLYTSARKDFDNSRIFSNELANAYMQSGKFKEAVREYYEVVSESPQQMSYVQQWFLRMRDDNLYEIAALELEDYLLELDRNDAAYSQLYQLLSWLLLETEEYRRAFVFARQYESRTEQTNYSLFSLANRLRSARQFELAAEAFSFYMNSSSGLQTRAAEEKVMTFLEWARHIEEQGVQKSRSSDELNEEAYTLAKRITEQSPNYGRMERVLSTLIDLSLDFYKDADKAETWYLRLNSISDSEETTDAYALYAEGRIALFNGSYTTARQALTRADRQSEDSNLSEKSRYYLSLSDFFAGDFEFAQIQLQSLERRNTSFYANNAVKLKMWIKNGTRLDSTYTALKEFSEGLRLIHTGRYDEALSSTAEIINSPAQPFSDDLAIELSRQLPDRFDNLLLQIFEKQIAGNLQSPLRERLMWERATLAERLLGSNGEMAERNGTEYEKLLDRQHITISELSKSDVDEMFEEILIEFPDGFYARFARQKLQESTQEQTI